MGPPEVSLPEPCDGVGETGSTGSVLASPPSPMASKTDETIDDCGCSRRRGAGAAAAPATPSELAAAAVVVATGRRRLP